MKPLNVHKLERWSFKDWLTIVFFGFFFNEVLKDNLPMVNALVPLGAVILGGYFGSEVYSHWADRRYTQNTTDERRDSYHEHSERPI